MQCVHIHSSLMTGILRAAVAVSTRKSIPGNARCHNASMSKPKSALHVAKVPCGWTPNMYCFLGSRGMVHSIFQEGK
eukprot:3180950-Pyramimonas_sp.AAC.1